MQGFSSVEGTAVQGIISQAMIKILLKYIFHKWNILCL